MCPYRNSQNFSITFYFECQEDSAKEKGPTEISLDDQKPHNHCDYYVKVYDETGCPVLSMPSFTIFIDQWPWMIAYGLVALGAYMLIFGRKHFSRILKLFTALFMVCVVACLLSINGRIEAKIAEGPSGGIIFFLILVLALALLTGFMLGSKMSHKFGLIFICFTDAIILSLLFYAFLMTFTGTWVMLMLSCLFFIALCIYLPLKYSDKPV